MEFSGIFAALTTQFAPDGALALDDFKSNLARYNKTKLAGYLVLGSTGEGVMLTRDEHDAMLEAGKEAAASSKKLFAGTGAESTTETIARTKRAAELKYDAALVMTPQFYKAAYKPELLITHYQRVADASTIPVMLYSVPQFTGVTLEPPTVAKLSEHPNIIGIKDSSGNFERFNGTIAMANPKFQVFTGSAPMVYEALQAGGRGAILALASALPEKFVELYELTCQGQKAQAQKLQEALTGASRLITSESSVAGIKAAMDAAGYRGGLPRPPLQPLNSELVRAIRDLMASFSVQETSAASNLAAR